MTSLEPVPPGADGAAPRSVVSYDLYPWLYAAKILIVTGCVFGAWPALRSFRFRIHPLAVAVGAVGVVLWIVLTKLEWESTLLKPLLGSWWSSETRAAFNPFERLADSTWQRWAFLAVRFWGLVVIVPIAEELFYRGFLMRFLTRPDWWTLSLGDLSWQGIAVGTLLPALLHPELFAAIVWFSLVTWLMLRTRNLWDCIIAHATTNLLLGLYVVTQGEWRFW